MVVQTAARNPATELVLADKLTRFQAQAVCQGEGRSNWRAAMPAFGGQAKIFAALMLGTAALVVAIGLGFGLVFQQAFNGREIRFTMSGRFDPYHHWLGIPAQEQPPNHYRLLGIAPFEENISVIEHATDQRMGYLRTFQTGRHQSMNEVIVNLQACEDG